MEKRRLAGGKYCKQASNMFGSHKLNAFCITQHRLCCLFFLLSPIFCVRVWMVLCTWIFIYLFIYLCYVNSIKTVGHLDGGWGAEWINIKARNREKKGWQWDLCACERARLLLSADVCVCVCASVCGHMLWWLHSKGFMLMLESHRVIMYCCMMGMPFTFYIWAEVARWNTRTHAHARLHTHTNTKWVERDQNKN